jgi:hypothetical protein
VPPAPTDPLQTVAGGAEIKKQIRTSIVPSKRRVLRDVRWRGDDVELRQGVAADASAIRELTREAYAKWVPLIGASLFAETHVIDLAK